MRSTPLRGKPPVTGPLVEPTPAEAANGWTAEALTEHVRQTESAEHHTLMERLFPSRSRVIVEDCFGFNPHHW